MTASAVMTDPVDPDVETKNLSQIARNLNLSPSYVSLVLRGKRNPTLKVARQLADALGLSLDEFYLIHQTEL